MNPQSYMAETGKHSLVEGAVDKLRQDGGQLDEEKLYRLMTRFI